MYQIVLLPHFKKTLKKLSKKYPELKESIIKTLEKFQPTRSIHLGKNLIKSD